MFVVGCWLLAVVALTYLDYGNNRFLAGITAESYQ